MKLFDLLRDWSEVWALLIPLIVILVHRPKGSFVKWVTWYVLLGLLFNFLATCMNENYRLFPLWLSMHGNNIFYNLHSFFMAIFLGWYIVNTWESRYGNILRMLIGGYIFFVIVNFILWESLFKLSTHHFTAGSIVLLILCLSYFLHILISDNSKINWIRHPSFIICVAVFLYQAITFFIFLFFYPLNNNASAAVLSFALFMMRVYQAAFIVFCILLAIGLYKYKKAERTIP